MGQAKQRGTAEERAQMARNRRHEGLQPVDIESLRAEYGLPSDAKFLGFVVWIADRDEFLLKVEAAASMTKRYYGPQAELAEHFPTWDAAAAHAKQSNHQAVVAAAFDTGDKIVVIGG